MSLVVGLGHHLHILPGTLQINVRSSAGRSRNTEAIAHASSTDTSIGVCGWTRTGGPIDPNQLPWQVPLRHPLQLLHDAGHQLPRVIPRRSEGLAGLVCRTSLEALGLGVRGALRSLGRAHGVAACLARPGRLWKGHFEKGHSDYADVRRPATIKPQSESSPSVNLFWAALQILLHRLCKLHSTVGCRR